MSIDVLFEMVTAVGAPLLVNVAVPSGTAGEELQLVPVVHSLPAPSQVPSTACAGPTADATSAAPADHAMHFATPTGIPDGRIRLDCMCSRTHPRTPATLPNVRTGTSSHGKKSQAMAVVLGT